MTIRPFFLSALLVTAQLMCSTTAWAQTAPKPMREVNITSDSAPGWLPSEADDVAVRAAFARYFAAVDSGQFQAAYDMMSPINRQYVPFASFEADGQRFNGLSGALRARNIVKITWTKAPANAPYPGLYAAIDMSARFANIDRDCGYIVLYSRQGGEAFSVMRLESNYLDNATARSIEQTKSKAEVDTVWAQLSANCPNFTAQAPGQ